MKERRRSSTRRSVLASSSASASPLRCSRSAKASAPLFCQPALLGGEHRCRLGPLAGEHTTDLLGVRGGLLGDGFSDGQRAPRPRAATSRRRRLAPSGARSTGCPRAGACPRGRRRGSRRPRLQGRASPLDAQGDERRGKQDGRGRQEPERVLGGRRRTPPARAARAPRPRARACPRPTTTSRRSRRTGLERRRWASESSVAHTAARPASSRSVPVCATYPVSRGNAPHASAKPRSVCTLPPSSSRL